MNVAEMSGIFDAANIKQNSKYPAGQKIPETMLSFYLHYG